MSNLKKKKTREKKGKNKLNIDKNQLNRNRRARAKIHLIDVGSAAKELKNKKIQKRIDERRQQATESEVKALENVDNRWKPAKNDLAVKKDAVDWKAEEARMREDLGNSSNQLDPLVNNLATNVDNADWVMINENHNNKDGFALARMVIEKSKKPGQLILEVPFALNWQLNLVGAINYWGNQQAKNPAFGAIAQLAASKGWDIVPVDSTHMTTGGNNKEALAESSLPGFDNEEQLGLTQGGVLRQNYIARNANYAMNQAKQIGRGGIFLVGGKHIWGDSDFGVKPYSEMVTGKGYKDTNTYQLSKTIMGQVIDKNDINEKVQYTDPPKEQLDEKARSVIKNTLKKQESATSRLNLLKKQKSSKRLINAAENNITNFKKVIDGIKFKFNLNDEQLDQIKKEEEEKAKAKAKKLKGKKKTRKKKKKNKKKEITTVTEIKPKSTSPDNAVQDEVQSTVSTSVSQNLSPELTPLPVNGNYLQMIDDGRLNATWIDGLSLDQKQAIYNALNDVVTGNIGRDTNGLTKKQNHYYEQLRDSITRSLE